MTTFCAVILIFPLCIYLCSCEANRNKLILPMPMCTSWDKTCLEQATMLGLKLLREPQPKARLPSLDPLIVERMHVRPNLESNVCFTQDYYNMEFRGMSDALVRNFTVAINSTHVAMNFSLYMDTFEVISWYRWNGTVLDHRLDGYGLGNITSVNVTHIHMLILKRRSNDKLSLNQYEVDLRPRGLLFDMSNMVQGNPEASQKVEDLFNKYGMRIFNEVKLDYERVFAKVCYPYVCAFFRDLKLQDLFLDAPASKRNK